MADYKSTCGSSPIGIHTLEALCGAISVIEMHNDAGALGNEPPLVPPLPCNY